jgi:hypothetical protein
LKDLKQADRKGDAGVGCGCTLIQPSFISNDMKENLSSNQWYERIQYISSKIKLSINQWNEQLIN